MWKQTDYVIRSQSPIFQISNKKCRFFSVEIHFLNCSILHTHTYTQREKERERARSMYICSFVYSCTSFGPWAQYNKYLLDQYRRLSQHTASSSKYENTNTCTTNMHTHAPQMSVLYCEHWRLSCKISHTFYRYKNTDAQLYYRTRQSR